MSAPALKKYGSLSALDSGPPPGRRDYTTLIIFHGVGWHAATFEKLFPLVESRNVRLLAANRQGYPGAEPLSAEAKEQLNNIAELASTDPQKAGDAHLAYVKEDTKKTLHFLADFISKENIPVEGGVVVAGWSLGASTILGLLAYAGDIPSKEFEVDLRPYIKHLILYDAPSTLLGYAPPPNVFNPLLDPSLTPGEAFQIFPGWVSAYYAHGEDLMELGYEALDYPPPTIPSMDALDVQRCSEGNATGPDVQFTILGVQLGAFSLLKERAMFPKQGAPHTVPGWDSVAVKYVWFDQTMWDVPWGVRLLEAELDDSKVAGKFARKVDMVRVRGGNHFCHWDMPDLALSGLLSGL